MEENKGKGQEFQSAVSKGKVYSRERKSLLSHEDVVTRTAGAEHRDVDYER